MAVINYLTKIIFDDGALACLAEEVARLELSKILLVTDALQRKSHGSS